MFELINDNPYTTTTPTTPYYKRIVVLNLTPSREERCLLFDTLLQLLLLIAILKLKNHQSHTLLIFAILESPQLSLIMGFWGFGDAAAQSRRGH